MWIGTAARVAIALGLMTLVVWMNRAELADVFSRRPDFGAFALAFACYLTATVLAFLRWHGLVRAQGLEFRRSNAVRYGFIGLLFNLVIPGAIGGDFVKAAFLCRTQHRKAAAIASVAIDRLVAVFALFLLAALVGTLGRSALDERVRRLVTTAWIATGVVGLILAIAFTPALYRPLVRLAGPRPKLARRLDELVAVGAAYRDRIGVVALSVMLALVTYGLHVLAFYLASRSLFARVPGLAEHFLIVPLVLFTTAIPLPFGALGVSEQISSGVFRLARTGRSAYDGGAVAMMAFRVLQYGGALIGGVLFLLHRQQVRELAAEAEVLAAEEAAFSPAAAPEG